MTALEHIIKQKIRERGPGGYMDLGEYMSLCLSHPEHGYYMTRDPFGQKGDFTTAPEISQMFGEMIGVWVADTWIKMGSPKKIIILECGPGRGTLMADAMRVTKNVDGFHDAVQLHLLEMSPVLKDIQKDSLKEYGATWHSEPESVPTDSPLIVIGNEFLDALPVRQLVFTETGWQEKVVKININDTLRLHEIGLKKEVKSLLPSFLIPPKLGDHVEVSLELNDFINKITKIILNQGGSALFLDYGFNQMIAGETLQAVKNHRYCDIFDTPGQADLSAHVNFADLSHKILEKNMTLHGPVSQRDFLKRLGIDIRAENLHRLATQPQRVEIDSALKRLTGEDTGNGEMGTLFKVIAFSSDSSIDLAGFA
ncbi:MAG: SAM-dependent methyltransferase [Alphaproteobacteria bacterium]